MKRLLSIFLACFISAMLLMSLPLLDFLSGGLDTKKKQKVIEDVRVAEIKQPKPPQQQKPQLEKPKIRKPTRSTPNAGPRFAADLGVASGSGASLPLNQLQGQSSGGQSQGVDKLPLPEFPPPFRMPDQVRESEQDAFAMVSFCVDPSGRAYDIRVQEETPAGSGMGSAGKQALQQTVFTPAQREGKPVGVCGLQQPFEVKFRD